MASVDKCAAELSIDARSVLNRDREHKAWVLAQWAEGLREEGKAEEAHIVERGLREWEEAGFENNDGWVRCNGCPTSVPMSTITPPLAATR